MRVIFLFGFVVVRFMKLDHMLCLDEFLLVSSYQVLVILLLSYIGHSTWLPSNIVVYLPC
jgi:hypothetical protein